MIRKILLNNKDSVTSVRDSESSVSEDAGKKSRVEASSLHSEMDLPRG